LLRRSRSAKLQAQEDCADPWRALRCPSPSPAAAAGACTKESSMNLTLTGHQLDITPAIRTYVVGKLERIGRHFDSVIDVGVVLSVDKLRHKAEANVHVRGKDLHAEAVEEDMYASIDLLVDKLDRMVVKHKEMRSDHRPVNGTARRTASAEGAE
jgi:putative sigma-54 modulation protein